jgi:aldehyde dehydrogenase (NAD+)
MQRIEQQYVNGQLVESRGREVLELLNPATEEPRARVVLGDERDIRDAVAAARAALPAWSATGPAERGALFGRIHDAILAREADMADAAVEEYGVPVAAAHARVRAAAQVFLRTRDLLAEFPFERRVGKARVVLEPLGVAGFITPWNANYTHLAKAAAALAVGCTTVIKPSELSALQTRLMIDCFEQAGVPAGAVNIVNGLGEVAGAELTRHPDVAVLSFTGSSRVGRIIRRDSAETLKRVCLELGGKSANILLESADFARAVPMAVGIAFHNNGQACHAGTRLLVPERRLDEAKGLARAAVAAVRVGDPRDPAVTMGPLVSREQWDTVQGYIRSGLDQGAELLVGGPGRPEGLARGYFVRPTAFARVRPDMTIAQEEIFGPVLSILAYRDEDEAVEIANGTIYGLSAYVSGDPARAAAMARRLVAGSVLLNQAVHDEPLAPFGGFKQSGLGREKGVYGMLEFTEPKTILGDAR